MSQLEQCKEMKFAEGSGPLGMCNSARILSALKASCTLAGTKDAVG